MTEIISKIHKTEAIIKKAAQLYKPEEIAIAWTGGKDSTVLLHCIKSIYGNIPFPVVFNDSGMEFPEIYDFIRNISEKWKLQLTIVPHTKQDQEDYLKTQDFFSKRRFSRVMKINAINEYLKDSPVKSLMAGIRWDEHWARSKEKYISPRNGHTRIHPLLHFTEKDIWTYIKTNNVPYVTLYDQGYRSLGEKTFTQKAEPGEGERSGREQEKESLMEKLRNMGYW
jgi:phosphoadenosine phosphosulfate reductase